VCPPLLVLAAVLVSRRRKMQVPMCEPHRAKWQRWDRAATRSYLLVVGGAYVAAVVLLAVLPADWAGSVFDPTWPAEGLKWILIPLAYYVVGLAWFVPMSILQTRQVRSTQATGQGIRLSGVHAEFVQAVREDRARDPDPARLALFGDARDDYDDEPP
jgi:hypothetical protein